jgi:outer membrane protein
VSKHSTSASLWYLGGLLAALLVPGLALANPSGELTTIPEVLDALVDETLAANLELRQSDTRLAQRLAAIEQARARFLPEIDFGFRYSRADGGRTIDVPVGDLLNPAYDAIDELLEAAGETPRFGAIENTSIQLLREREQRTALTVTQPLYDARLAAAERAAQHEYVASTQARGSLLGRLLRDVRQGYFTLLAAEEAVRILDASRELAHSNLSVNESLYRNGRVTRDLVFRAEADLLEIEQQQLEARNLVRQALGLVNALRDAPLTAPVTTVAIDAAAVTHYRERFAARLAGREPDLDLLSELALDRRRELAGFDAAIAAGEARQDLARAAFKPQIALGIDAGFEDDTFSYGADTRFVLASVIVRWSLYSGGGDRARVREAAALVDELRATRDVAAQQIRLEVQRALDDLEVADASIETAEKRVAAADGSFRIASRKRDLGTINQTEFIDARRALTSASLNLNVTRARFLGRLAELEYATGVATP